MSIENVIHADAVADYTESHLVPKTRELEHAYSNSTAHGIPEIAISPAQGKFLSLLTTACGAKNVLELGTLGGYSGIWFAKALQERGGKLTSIEIDAARRDVAIQNLEYAGIKVPEQVEIVLGAGLDVLPQILKDIQAAKRERFDFVFIDADWENQWNYFDWAVKLAKGKGSVIYVDNTVRELLENGSVGPNEKDPNVDSLVEKVGEDDRVDATVIQTVGSKSYDGFLLAVVK